MRRPVAVAIWAWRESGAGIDAAPGKVKPSASAALVMVLAVPMVMQWPGLRAMPLSSSSHCSRFITPARTSFQPLNMSEPEPNVLPAALPRSIGPAGMKIIGRPIEVAPMISPGVVLSQPPISTTPSTGCERSNSSASIASRLRYNSGLGFWNGSAIDIAGISSGKPPACQTPRLISSTRCLKWLWQELMSLQVLRMAMMGLSA